MRRKLWTMAAVGALLAILCLFEQISVARLTGMALEETAQILQLIREENLPLARERANALDQKWDKDAVMLELMIDHSATDDVRYALSRLLAALESGDQPAAMIYAGELEGGIEHVYERQALTLENVL